ncbi:cation:proton antiporter [Microbacterium esteraromaticum]|uniref:cation:proton antiporter n=1 Tax=Microbacterium esteraromaticum TaxID=57043 RepID=UPI001C986A15|nr:cation:proton antiporter [Microbacterium esteraromaticum]MBY6061475.1 cation:proton antiporter [Microbacterium esteraromaticum]
MEESALGLVLIPLLAVLAPLLGRAIGPIMRVPVVVFELLLGILVGPAVFGWVHPNEFIGMFSEFGLAMLFFLAGSEIDFATIGRRPLARASLGWALSIVLGLGVGFLLVPGEGMIVIAIALSSTALGTLMPILRDAGELTTPFGRAVTVIGTVGEFLPLIAISIFLGVRSASVATVVLLLFVVLALLAVFAARRIPHGRLHAFVSATLHTSAQFGVRFLLLLIAALVALSLWLDLDILLGAFVAGTVWRIVISSADEEDAAQVDSKIEGIAFGFLVPIFFIYTGVTFDLQALLESPLATALVPVLLLAMLIIRGTAAQFSASDGMGMRDRSALAFLAATGLPIIVAVAAIGVDRDLIGSHIAAALIGAGMLSVLLYPLIGMTLRGDRAAVQARAGSESQGEL